MICSCSLAGINWPSDISMEPDSTETGLTPMCRRNHGGDISGKDNGSVPLGGGYIRYTQCVSPPGGGGISGTHNGLVHRLGVGGTKESYCPARTDSDIFF